MILQKNIVLKLIDFVTEQNSQLYSVQHFFGMQCEVQIAEGGPLEGYGILRYSLLLPVRCDMFS